MRRHTLALLAPFSLLVLLASAPAAAQSPADSVARAAALSRSKGAADAPITIVELSDFQCPFCAEFARNTLAALDSAYLSTGQARLVFYNLPLPSHPAAWSAAEAALCAGAQGKFWEYHDRLFAEQKDWSQAPRPAEHFERLAAGLGLAADAFRTCTRDDQVATVLTGDLLQAGQSGLGGTPTFLILRAPRPGEGPEQSQRLLSGAQPFEEFRKAIEALSR